MVPDPPRTESCTCTSTAVLNLVGAAPSERFEFNFFFQKKIPSKKGGIFIIKFRGQDRFQVAGSRLRFSALRRQDFASRIDTDAATPRALPRSHTHDLRPTA
eukprot:SAG31_NODE_566_length_14037_cov_32.372148_4_plen_102_part_00